MLTDLPVCITSAIVSQWLLLSEVAAADEAICKRRERMAWLEVLAAHSTTLAELPELHSERNLTRAMSWLLSRKAKVCGCFIPVQLAAKNLPPFETFMAHIGKHLSYSEVAVANMKQSVDHYSVLSIIAANAPELKGLKVNKQYASPQIKDEEMMLKHIELLVTQCPYLQQLDLILQLKAPLAQAVAGLTNMLCLQVYCVSPGCLTIVANNCRRLRAVCVLDLQKIAFAEIEALVTSCTDLTMLSLQGTQINDALLNLVATHVGGRLKVLELGDSAKWATPEGLLNLLRHCPNLHGLRISGRHLFPSEQPDANLKEQFGYCRQLRELDAWCSRNIYLVHLARNCPGLRYLTVDSSSDSGRGLVYVLKQCPKLRTLVIGNDERVDLWHSATYAFLEAFYPDVEVECESGDHLPIWDEYVKKGLY